MAAIEQKITPHLWFTKGAVEAARFYVTLAGRRLLQMKKLDIAALERAADG
jgi:predicted 3-demethylubiquinone-9 3-methyltransferase (glyoxalase superfamily)